MARSPRERVERCLRMGGRADRAGDRGFSQRARADGHQGDLRGGVRRVLQAGRSWRCRRHTVQDPRLTVRLRGRRQVETGTDCWTKCRCASGRRRIMTSLSETGGSRHGDQFDRAPDALVQGAVGGDDEPKPGLPPPALKGLDRGDRHALATDVERLDWSGMSPRWRPPAA